MDRERRKFLTQTLKFGASFLAVGGLGGVLLRSKPAGTNPPATLKMKQFVVPDAKPSCDIVICRGSDHYTITRKALEVFGGMSQFIKKGDTVFIKPNSSWNRPPELAANTNPLVLKAVIDLVLKEGARRVIVADNSCNNMEKSFKSSGILEVSQKSGAEVIFPTDEKEYIPLIGSGTPLDTWKFLKILGEVDKVINIPVVKSHSLSRTTVSMKNWLGVVTGKRSLFHQQIHQSIAYFGKMVKPTLVVADATRVMMKNGPAGGTLDDVKVFNEVIVSCDQVLVDAYGSSLLGYGNDLPDYILIAERLGVGKKDVDHAKKEIVTI